LPRGRPSVILFATSKSEALEMALPSLEDRIRDRTARVSVVGIGYVGEPLAFRVKDAGYDVTGIDRYADDERIDELADRGLAVSRDFSPVGGSDVVVICVPTPLGAGQQPDTSHVEEAAGAVADAFGDGDSLKLVVLESTSYPGTTRELVLPLFEAAGLGLDGRLRLAYSPERVDPGTGRDYGEIPRLVGGMDAVSADLAEAFYANVVDKVMVVSSPEVAEMAKLLENIFRAVNIALVNELSLLCRRMDLSIWEVVEAAATKPFGFMSFKPGPGMGGHCIPVDPFFLSWKARDYDFYPEFIELAGKINRNMPYAVAEWVAETLNSGGRSVSGSRVLVVGVAYKEDVGDTRESPALKVIELLAGMGAEVHYHDPLVPDLEIAGRQYESEPLDREVLESYDCVAILTAHSELDRDAFRGIETPIVDTRNALGGG
jgi:UDP-N-acetyl-D-glucosamine dehydrogenase